MKKLVALCLVFLMVFAMAACGQSEAPAAEPEATEAAADEAPAAEAETTEDGAMPDVSGSYNIGTASIGGAFYPFGQEIANLVGAYTNLNMVPEVTGGATENPRLLADGSCDFAITNENVAVYAINGEDAFEGTQIEMYGMGRLYPSVFHIVALEGSGIESIADLKGKRVAVGPAGGGTLPVLNQLFPYYDMTIDDIVASYLPYTDGLTQLSDGNVDAAIALGGYPNSAVLEASATKDIMLIPIDEEIWTQFIEDYPYYSKTLVTKDYYNCEEDCYLIGIPNVLVVRPGIDDDVVYAVTKAIFDNIEEFQAANANARDLSMENASSMSIEWHPGAAKYFQEHGYEVG